MQRISVNGTLSNTFALERCDPQGSYLGPLLFTIYTSKLFDILRLHLPSTHSYADDRQLHISFRSSGSLSELEAVMTLENCILEVRAWTREDMWWLNEEKTEFLLVGSCRWLRCLSTASRLVKLMWFLCRLQGIRVFASTRTWICLLMYPELAAAHATIFITLKHIRTSLSRARSKQLVHAFITSRLDYCNSLLYGVLDCRKMKLQRVMNVSVRLIYSTPKFCHIRSSYGHALVASACGH